MALTKEEQERLKKLGNRIEEGAVAIAEAIKEGTTTVVRSGVRNLREWIDELEKNLDKKEGK